MANTSAVYARVDSDLKTDAEAVLSRLGVTPSSAIQMLYSQIVLTQGLPFEVRLPRNVPTSMRELTKEEIDIELARGLESTRTGRVHSAGEVDRILAEKFDL